MTSHDDALFEMLMGEVKDAKEECKERVKEDKERGVDFLNAFAKGEIKIEKKVPSRDASKGKNSPAYDLGGSDEQIMRLTSKVFLSPFDILMLTPDAPEDLVKKRYRKLSLLVHPDKNNGVELAQDAFQIVSKAYADITSGETHVDLSKYNEIFDEAKRRVKRTIREINALRKAKGESALSCKDEDITEDVIEMCEDMLSKMEERKEYAKATLQENFDREEEEIKKTEEQEALQKELIKEFKKGRNSRGEYWKNFKKQETTRGTKRSVGFTKEEAKEDQDTFAPTQQASNLKTKRRKGAVGLDESWKAEWR